MTHFLNRLFSHKYGSPTGTTLIMEVYGNFSGFELLESYLKRNVFLVNLLPNDASGLIYYFYMRYSGVQSKIYNL